MNGRLENDIKREKQIKNIISILPKYVSEWNNVMIAAKNTSASRLDFVRKINRFLRYLNEDVMEINPINIKKQDVDGYLSSIAITYDKNGNPKETSDSYKISVWSCLNNFFEFLVEYEYIDKNPINMKKKPKNKDLQKITAKRKLLTIDDFNQIIGCVEEGVGSKKARTRQEKWAQRDILIFLFFMITGIRETALSEINISDIDFNDMTFVVRDKGDKTLKFYINDKLKIALTEWLRCRNLWYESCNTDALFISYKGERLSSKSIVKIVKKYSLEALGYEISPHKLRAGFISIMYDKTNDIEKVRRMIGHANVATTQRYITTMNVERRESAELMQDLLG